MDAPVEPPISGMVRVENSETLFHPMPHVAISEEAEKVFAVDSVESLAQVEL